MEELSGGYTEFAVLDHVGDEVIEAFEFVAELFVFYGEDGELFFDWEGIESGVVSVGEEFFVFSLE